MCGRIQTWAPLAEHEVPGVCPMCPKITHAAGGDGKYRDLEYSIFSRAVIESNPPKKPKHRAYLGPGGLDPDFMRMSLTEQLALSSI